MTISTILQTVYSSAPPEELLLSTIEISVEGLAPLRFVDGFEDQRLGGFPDNPFLGTYRAFEATSISLSLPDTSNKGNQTLRFGFAGVSGKAMDYVNAVVEGGAPAFIIYREYLLSNKEAPARTAYKMAVVGGAFEGADVVFEAAYMDLLNLSWPRDRYTSVSAPGVQHL